jgi:hypothetical protein
MAEDRRHDVGGIFARRAGLVARAPEKAGPAMTKSSGWTSWAGFFAFLVTPVDPGNPCQRVSTGVRKGDAASAEHALSPVARSQLAGNTLQRHPFPVEVIPCPRNTSNPGTAVAVRPSNPREGLPEPARDGPRRQKLPEHAGPWSPSPFSTQTVRKVWYRPPGCGTVLPSLPLPPYRKKVLFATTEDPSAVSGTGGRRRPRCTREDGGAPGAVGA